ncbi:class F sortase [Streptomyces coeruleorubidus]|uniref:class F sortase n=1 Tax=Streptomyces coeruleorubidus TaxID=116188 RepID=UPI0033A60EA2
MRRRPCEAVPASAEALVPDAGLPPGPDDRRGHLVAARCRLLGPGRRARRSGHGPSAGLGRGCRGGCAGRFAPRLGCRARRRGPHPDRPAGPHPRAREARAPHRHAPRTPVPYTRATQDPRPPHRGAEDAAPAARSRRPQAQDHWHTHPHTRPTRPATPPPGHPPPAAPSRATRLLIPYLRVDAPVMDLGLDREHRLTAPPEDDPKLVGWYKQGASPGERGTAVAVGHLDTDSGPAVFAGLTELKPGRVVKVRRADGRIAVYTVDKIKSYEKAHFPSQEVYGTRGRPELRLITCGGSYDRRKGYSGNVVVFAHLTGIR